MSTLKAVYYAMTVACFSVILFASAILATKPAPAQQDLVLRAANELGIDVSP
jgi:beta-phosphoglucomutase-like phosphatase (HAD superfamily)